MSHEMLITVLEQYGFSKNESLVYLTILELGHTPPSVISRRTGIPRTTVYSVKNSLEKKQVLSSFLKKGQEYLTVISPQELSQRLEEKVALFQQTLPAFDSIMNRFDAKPSLEYFEGIHGIKELYNDILKYPGELWAFMGEGELHEGFRGYLYDDFLPKRIQKDIWAHVILSSSEAHEAYVAMEDEETKKSVVYIQDTNFTLHSEMILYGENRIVCAMYTPSELCGFRLVSDSLWKSWKSIFDLVWRMHAL